MTRQYSFPDTWPRAEDRRYGPSGRATPRTSVLWRITDDMRQRLWDREVTSRELAAELGITEGYISHLFPGKAESSHKAKKVLLAARRKVRHEFAMSVINKERTTEEAASVLKIRYQAMARLVRLLRKPVEAQDAS